MHTDHYRAYAAEIEAAQTASAAGDRETAFTHLERAHMLGARHAVTHFQVHLAMAAAAWRAGDRGEFGYHLLRLLTAVPSSLAKTVPVGHPGRPGVPAFRKRPLPEDLENRYGGWLR